MAGATSPSELCEVVAEAFALHERRGELVEDLLRALEAAKLRERQAAACQKALSRRARGETGPTWAKQRWNMACMGAALTSAGSMTHC